MTRQSFNITLAAACVALVGLASDGHAQSIELGDGTIDLVNSEGSSLVTIDHEANYRAGGSGWASSFSVRASDNSPGLSFLSGSGFGALRLGGDPEGVLLLQDDDGATTTVEADGLTGALRLGGDGEDGDMIVYDNTDTVTFQIDGQTGTANNVLGGNGLVKAWAKVDSDGSLVSCWRCLLSVRLSEGVYQVRFSPSVGGNLHGRPRTAFLDSHDTGPPEPGLVRLVSSALPRTVLAHTGSLPFGASADRAFTVLIY